MIKIVGSRTLLPQRGAVPEPSQEVAPRPAQPTSRVVRNTAQKVAVAVLVPVLNRPGHVRPLVQSLEKSEANARIYFLVGEDDQAELAAIREEVKRSPRWCAILVVQKERQSWAQKINDGIRSTSEQWILCGADDIRFHRGFLVATANLMRDPKIGVIGTCDLGHRGTMEGWHSTHPLVSRNYARTLGSEDNRRTLVHEGYRHNFADTEIVATARKRGAYAHCKKSIVEHLHPFWGKAADDKIYQLGRRSLAKDRSLFIQRTRKFGWETRG